MKSAPFTDPVAKAVLAVESLRSWSRNGEFAPHKPLLILLAIGRVQAGGARLMEFSEIEVPLKELISHFGPKRSSYHPEYPFWRLQNEGIWEVLDAHTYPSRASNTDPPVTVLRSRHAQGGFVADLYSAFRRDPAKAVQFAETTATLHLPEVKSEALFAAGVSV